ncbi:hypothetical protein TNCV_2165641 [Trichonephila clavipes]|nr:hypothetical protein TNCV_2165641 [Trichonephila clavipes]
MNPGTQNYSSAGRVLVPHAQNYEVSSQITYYIALETVVLKLFRLMERFEREGVFEEPLGQESVFVEPTWGSSGTQFELRNLTNY